MFLNVFRIKSLNRAYDIFFCEITSTRSLMTKIGESVSTQWYSALDRGAILNPGPPWTTQFMWGSCEVRRCLQRCLAWTSLSALRPVRVLSMQFGRSALVGSTWALTLLLTVNAIQTMNTVARKNVPQPHCRRRFDSPLLLYPSMLLVENTSTKTVLKLPWIEVNSIWYEVNLR